MKNYILECRYKDLLQYHGINVEEVLKKAQLPGDALNHRTPTMTEEGYYRFMTAIGDLSDDDALPIKLSCTNKIEAFSPPIFAAYCAKPAELSWTGIWELRMYYLAFAVSFFGLAVMWANWHREWHDVKAISDKTVWGTITVLFFMAFVPYITGLIASDITNSVGQILYGSAVMMFTFFNSLTYRSLASIKDNSDISHKLKARSNLLLINSAIMLVSVILSLTVLP